MVKPSNSCLPSKLGESSTHTIKLLGAISNMYIRYSLALILIVFVTYSCVCNFSEIIVKFSCT